jgi:cell pole-organizing protein PopZ
MFSENDDDQEMSMDEILSSIRRYVSADEPTKKSHHGHSQRPQKSEPAKIDSTPGFSNPGFERFSSPQFSPQSALTSANEGAQLRSAPLHELLKNSNQNSLRQNQSPQNLAPQDQAQDRQVIDRQTPDMNYVSMNPNLNSNKTKMNPYGEEENDVVRLDAPYSKTSSFSVQTPAYNPGPYNPPSNTPSISQSQKVNQTTNYGENYTQTTQKDTPLLSDQTSDTVLSSFSKLNETVIHTNQSQQTDSRRSVLSEKLTLDQVFYDLARPMIHEWLEKNLPGMVESMVMKEIERITKNVP